MHYGDGIALGEPPLRHLSWLVLLAACVDAPAEGPARTTAHRAAAGYWPGNSASAVRGALAAGFEAIEVDLVMTRDGVPVLNHDPVLDPAECTTAKGKDLDGPVRIDEVRWSALQSDFLCGGTPHVDHPRAEAVAEPLMSLDELLEALRDADPNVGLHLDVKQDDNWTPSAEDFAEQVLRRWWQADLPQPMWVSAGNAATLQAFEDRATERGQDLHTVRIFPLGAYGDSDVGVALAAEWASLSGAIRYVDLIEASGSDGIYVHWEVARRSELLRARRAGYETGLWTVNEADARLALDHWPVDTWITDYPAGL